ncbi:MAG: nitrate reductase cytochrome c-type subunit [Acidobacteria bacterium]|nr:nitrate reductase cytochrome c-type subunit [Acidobacteriota bacterium]
MRIVRAAMGVLLAVLVSGLLARAMQAPTPPGAPVSDRDIGLRRTALTDDQAPPVYRYPEAAPGESARLPRSWEGAPPLVPHSLGGLIPITREENLCLLCHATGSTDPADPPQVPKSHLTDYRRAPDIVRESITGARWNCTACHVMQTDAPALVGNTHRAGIAK